MHLKKMLDEQFDCLSIQYEAISLKTYWKASLKITKTLSFV